jgi:hypothetical protein
VQIDVFNEIMRNGRLEREANAAQSDQEVALVSIAVSLKRIADALENAELAKQLSAIEYNTREVL